MSESSTNGAALKFEVSEFTKSQLDPESIALIAKSWINLLDVKSNGTPDTLTLIVEFVTPLPDGKIRWMKKPIIIDRDDYMLHEKEVIPVIVEAVEKARSILRAQGK